MQLTAILDVETSETLQLVPCHAAQRYSREGHLQQKALKLEEMHIDHDKSSNQISPIREQLFGFHPRQQRCRHQHRLRLNVRLPRTSRAPHLPVGLACSVIGPISLGAVVSALSISGPKIR
jgi:hypothetical protein